MLRIADAISTTVYNIFVRHAMSCGQASTQQCQASTAYKCTIVWYTAAAMSDFEAAHNRGIYLYNAAETIHMA